jgi:hypothetical protein
MGNYKRVYVAAIGSREFLVVEYEQERGGDGGVSLPIDRIARIDLDYPNGGCNNTVAIHVVGEAEPHHFAYDGADMLRAFLRDRAAQGPASDLPRARW